MIRRVLPAVAVLLSIVCLQAAEETPKVVVQAAGEAPKIVKAADTAGLAPLVGKIATVEGKVTRIGSTSGGGITFLNMVPGANGFVAVVFKSSYEAFVGGFDKYKDQTLRVTGKIELYKDTTPQIIVSKPEQIKIMPAAEPTPAAGAPTPAGVSAGVDNPKDASAVTPAQ